MTIRLVVADDHPVVLEGLVRIFEMQRDFEIVGTARDGDEALRVVRQVLPDVLVLDLRMPGKNGIEVMREFRRDGFAPRVVVLTAVHGEDVIEAIRLGAKGVVLKETATRLLLRCVREVHAGRKWLERSVAMQTVDVLLHRYDTTRTVAASLTPRELEVARFVADGLHSKAVAAKLEISEGTAKLHLHNVYKKLGVGGRVALAVYMHGRGLD